VSSSSAHGVFFVIGSVNQMRLTDNNRLGTLALHILACTQIHVHMHKSRNVYVGGEWNAPSWNFRPYHQVCRCWLV